MWQIQSLAVLTAINFRVRPPRFFRVTASLLDHIGRIKPPLQMPAAEFALVVFLVAGPLPGFLDFDLVMRKLCRSLRIGGGNFAGCQWTYPRRAALSRQIRTYERHCIRNRGGKKRGAAGASAACWKRSKTVKRRGVAVPACLVIRTTLPASTSSSALPYPWATHLPREWRYPTGVRTDPG